MEAEDIRFKIQIQNSETQLTNNFFRGHIFLTFVKKYACFKENYVYLKNYYYFSSKLIA